MVKKITVNIPERLLKSAIKITKKGITKTIIEGLHELEKSEKRSAPRALRGKVQFALNLKETRR